MYRLEQSPNLQMPVVSVAIDTTLNLVPVADELTATEVPADKESSCTSAAQRGYTTLASLGSGGFSDVFLVEDQRRQRFALKQMPRRTNSMYIRHELEAWSALTQSESKHIVKLVDR